MQRCRLSLYDEGLFVFTYIQEMPEVAMKKYVIMSSSVLFSILLIALGYTYYLYRSMEKTVDKMQITFDE